MNRTVIAILILGAGAGVLWNEQRSFGCTVSRVIDGDTLECREGRRVRLAGISAPELDARGGTASKLVLELLAPPGRRLRCSPAGRSYRRRVGWCDNLSCEAIRAGGARRWPEYDPRNRLRNCEGRQP